MPIKPIESVLLPDERFRALCIFDEKGRRPFEFADLYEGVVSISLDPAVPSDVIDAFDRARSVALYSFFDYDLFVLSELQALSTFELALKFCLDGGANASRGSLRKLVHRARNSGALPPIPSDGSRFNCPIERLIIYRNHLSHGNTEIHFPGEALRVVSSCARWINYLYVK